MTARNEHELWLAYEQQGVKAAQNRDEAMTLAKLLRAHGAYADPKDSRNALLKRDLKALYDVHVPNESTGDVMHVNGRAITGLGDPQLGRPSTTPDDAITRRWNAGASLDSFSPAERIQLRQMVIRQPAYRDAAHPDHDTFLQSAKALYAMDDKGGV